MVPIKESISFKKIISNHFAETAKNVYRIKHKTLYMQKRRTPENLFFEMVSLSNKVYFTIKNVHHDRFQ